MRKHPIKVIKRDVVPVPLPVPSADELLIEQQKVKDTEERGMADTVKNWISERRENSRAEDEDANRRFDS